MRTEPSGPTDIAPFESSYEGSSRRPPSTFQGLGALFSPVVLLFVVCGGATSPAIGQSWTPTGDEKRRALVTAELEANNAEVAKELLRQKLDAMDRSAFTFLRGSAHLYHRDLHDSALLEKSAFRLQDQPTWLQGDAHVRNIGVFADAGGEVIFDLDDFDQAWPGSYLVDVWRMATSLRLFAEQIDEIPRAENAEAGARAVAAFAVSYADSVIAFARDDSEKSFQLSEEEAEGPARRLILETLDEEGTRVMLEQWTRGKKEKRRFRSKDDLAVLDETEARTVRGAVAAYAAEIETSRTALGTTVFDAGHFRILDVARRLKAGIGSRGVDRFYVLIEGPPGKDDVILDLKSQVAEPTLSQLFESPADLPVAGCRVALAERAMLAAADGHLGCLEIDGRSFSVRQRNPYKKSMKAKKIDGVGDLEALARELGRALAAAHSRSDDDFAPGLIAGSFDQAFAEAMKGGGQEAEAQMEAFVAEVDAFSIGYAEQIKIDFDFFLNWRE